MKNLLAAIVAYLRMFLNERIGNNTKSDDAYHLLPADTRVNDMDSRSRIALHLIKALLWLALAYLFFDFMKATNGQGAVEAIEFLRVMITLY